MNRSNSESAFEHDYAKKVSVAWAYLLLAHIPVLALVAVFLNNGPVLALFAGIIIAAAPVYFVFQTEETKVTPILIAISIMCFSALLIHITRGKIESHFHIFVMIALLTIFGRAIPVIVAAATVASHHLLFWLWLPTSVFNYQAGLDIVLLHAFYVVLETVPACWLAVEFGRAIWARALVTDRLSFATDHVNGAARQLREASDHLAGSSSQQAAVIQETSASGHEVEKISDRNSQLASGTMESMQAIHQGMTEAGDMLQSVLQAVTEMANSSSRIASIIKLVDEIAFQTNILSLNAAVEAARAGESGLGFAVVAAEVRNLAQKSAQAASDTGDLIQRALSDAKSGQIAVARLAPVIDKVGESVAKTRREMEEIFHSSREQANLMKVINRSLERIEKVAQENAATAEQTAASGVELTNQALKLQDVVETIQAQAR